MEITFSVHAIKRMFQRHILDSDVRRVLRTGTTIEEYPEDQPFPSRLILGRSHGRPLHVVVAEDKANERVVVVTVYEPDHEEWTHGFSRRKI